MATQLHLEHRFTEQAQHALWSKPFWDALLVLTVLLLLASRVL